MAVSRGPSELRRGGRVMIKNEASARFRALSQRARVGPSYNAAVPCYRPGTSRVTQPSGQSNWSSEPQPSAGAGLPFSPRTQSALAVAGAAWHGWAIDSREICSAVRRSMRTA